MPTRQLTDEQKARWAIDGYLVLPGVLSRAEVARLRREVDRFYRKYVTRSPNGDPTKGLDHRNAIEDSEVLIEFIDHPVRSRSSPGRSRDPRNQVREVTAVRTCPTP